MGGVGEPLGDVHEVGALVRHVAAGIVPEQPPTAEAHRFEVALWGGSQKALPIEFALQWRIVQGLGYVPIPHGADQRDPTERAAIDEGFGAADERGRAALHPDLDDAVGLAYGLDHEPALF